jgi:hypothetical protein
MEDLRRNLLRSKVWSKLQPEVFFSFLPNHKKKLSKELFNKLIMIYPLFWQWSFYESD